MKADLTRRDFFKRAAQGTAAGLALSAAKPVVAASDKVRVGVIGPGHQGRGDTKNFAKQPDVEVVAVCDVYEPNLPLAVEAAGGHAQTYKDFRQILDRKDIDAVLIGTPDHWHSLMTVEACKAGKDVYVEKPLSHDVHEGMVVVEAARKYNRVVQLGTQQRSGIHFQKAVEIVQSGALGKISFVRTWTYGNSFPDGIGHPADSAPPAGLDWDAWLGPAPMVPFNVNRWIGQSPHGWSTFRYFWDYAGGMMTDWGVHLIDIVQWGMQVEGPKVISSLGGKYYDQDNSQTPDTLEVAYEYENPSFVLVYEHRWNNANSTYGKGYGIQFHGTDGTLFVDRDGFELFPETRKRDGKTVGVAPAMKMFSMNDHGLDHVRNFIDCVKSRQKPNSDIAIGHRSTSACLLGNVSYRSQQRLVWDVANQRLISGGPDAEQYLSREYREPWKLSA
ncbi:MAG: Gfo/Idh/MocA family oxidoreductase [Acidobacteriota bacterium]|nr:Gfo/Idh/MocA family oxidoreductase [Acidobacteriota bacterium]